MGYTFQTDFPPNDNQPTTNEPMNKSDQDVSQPMVMPSAGTPLEIDNENMLNTTNAEMDTDLRTDEPMKRMEQPIRHADSDLKDLELELLRAIERTIQKVEE